MLVQSLLASCVHSLRPRGGPVKLEASMLETVSGCPARLYTFHNQWQNEPRGIINVPDLQVNQRIRSSCKAVARWEFIDDPQSEVRPNWKDIRDDYVTFVCSAQSFLSLEGEGSCFA